MVYSRDHLGCFGTRDRGTCTNKLTVSRQEVEERVLRALQEKLLRKDFFDEFCREFAKEMNRLRMEQRAKLSGAKRELERVKRDIEKGVDAIMEGYRTPELKTRMEALQERKEALLAQLAIADEPPPLLHPGMADVYRSKVEELAAALRREDSRVEAAETLRGLIDSIVLTPQDGQLRVELKGNLAAMLAAAQPPSRAYQEAIRAMAVRRSLGEGGKTKRSPETGDLFVPIEMVAGARPRLFRRLCWTAA